MKMLCSRRAFPLFAYVIGAAASSFFLFLTTSTTQAADPATELAVFEPTLHSPRPLLTLPAETDVQVAEREQWLNLISAETVELLDTSAASIAQINYCSECSPVLTTEPPPKGFTVGAFRIIPYGTIWADMVFATSRTVPGRFALWIASEQDQGEAAFELDARRSRVGLDVLGPSIGCLDSGAKVEVDFLGNFTTDNQPDVRLRHAYWEAKNDDTRLLVGQTWDIVSPLLPNTVNFSVLWAAGNVGFRRTQARAERYIDLGSGTTWSLQGGIAQNIIQDLATGFSAAGVTRESGSWPMLQGRSAIAFNNVVAGGKTLALGVSGHLGETGFDFSGGHPANPALVAEDDARIETWSFNGDATIPLTERMSFQGEFFTGSNLSNILGGISQGVCPCLRVPIRSTGGWGELSYVLNKKSSLHFGYSIDDPNDADSLIGRTKNQVLYANIFYKFTDNLLTGFEVSNWRTDYHNRTNEPGYTFVSAPTEPGKAVLLDWMMRYTF
ncbi:hypothetical protein Poly41_42600 [Novipirellula artificiosorum]|uniref:Alginate export domain-containing protein n=2 Tax=Novipirellula artificiosorum TaxID=2528016 RepID=A0A5C6DJN0_9BACT|nr:hypothetical protein Poly41_42600 [Novipirellula artificiosorum]